MNNAEIIKGIDTTIAGLETIKRALMSEGAEDKKTKNSDVVPVKDDTEVEYPVVGKFDPEQLKSMKYNEFKKFAASLGVKCTGTRDEIMERIMALDVTITEDDAVVSEPEEEKPAKKSKVGKKKDEPVEEEPEKDEFDEQAEAVAEETAIEDIIEALADVNVKATKKNAVKKLAEALREGLIELDDEDEDEDEVEEEIEEVEAEVVEEDEEEEDDDEEISSTSYFPEYDPNGYNNPEEMTEERAEAIESKMDEILTDYSEESLTDEDIASYVEDNATEEEIELLGEEYTEEDILKLYMELIKRTIDNDGEEHEPGEPYEVADKDVCCGHELKYVKKTKKYICEHCGTEYEAE